MRKPVYFIFGPARGGTTYLGAIMDRWFDVGVGPEGTFVLSACRFGKKLGDLSNAINKRKYADYLSQVEMLEIIRKRYPADKSFDVSPDDILDRMPGDSIADGIYAVFKAVADYRGRTRVGNKNPAYWQHLNKLYELFPDNSRFLFINRDGRDVALSLKDVPWGGQSVYESALEWRKMVRAVEDFRKVCPEDRLLTVRYEDLLSSPHDAMMKICDFMQVDNGGDIAKGFEQETVQNQKKNNFDKWKNAMSEREIQVFEAICGQELRNCNYERRFEDASLGFYQSSKYKLKRYHRLIKLNLYQMGRKLPQDTLQGQPTKIKALFQPGGKKKK